ncbi:MAG: amidohydrolase family protein [Candidatus Hydrogenedentes bacterium]|nr:amidohydrolase family protein [Candidatus Hydrogenedentota bacterium]
MKHATKDGAIVVRGKLLGGSKLSDVVVRNGKVEAVRPAGRGAADIGGPKAFIGPTLFDIQVNGFGGINLQGDKVVPEDFSKIGAMLAKWGVSHWIPTLITGAQRDMEHGCRIFVEALQDKEVARAVPGIHLEGPYISPVDGPRGAHAKRHVRKPSIREFDRLMKAADGKISYTTVAPELPGAIEYIKAVTTRGVVVSLGHHNGSTEEIARAVDAGATLCTHVGNGIAAQINRHFNPIWPQLADDRLTCSFIADLEHLPENVLKVFMRAKGPERTILTSDVVHIAGLKPGHYDLGGMPVELKPSGRICLSGTELLAGSTLVLLQGIVNVAEHTDLTLEEAFASASRVPAKALGLKHKFDLPRRGRKADFVVFELAGAKGRRNAKVRASFVNGRRMV